MTGNDTNISADDRAQAEMTLPKMSAHCHLDCTSDDMTYPRAKFWERYWARCKLWHSTTMIERHFRLIANEFDLIAKPGDPELSSLWEQAQAKRNCLECKIKLRYKLPMTEVFGFERLVLHLLPDDRLLSKAWSIRDAYRRLVPDDMYRKYEESKPPELWRDPKKNIEDELHKAVPNGDVSGLVDERYNQYLMHVRTDAEDILNATHWWYTNSNYREGRIQAVKQKLLWLVFIFLFLISALSLNSAVMQSTMLVVVVLMGMLGAIFSIAMRILPVSTQDVTQSDPVIRATQFDHGGTGISLSIFVGGVSAMVLYLLMGAGIARIDTALFPVTCGHAENFASNCKVVRGDGISLKIFFLSLMPADPVSYAKLMCWSFIAGFAEKFVPDILDRMAKEGKSK